MDPTWTESSAFLRLLSNNSLETYRSRCSNLPQTRQHFGKTSVLFCSKKLLTLKNCVYVGYTYTNPLASLIPTRQKLA